MLYSVYILHLTHPPPPPDGPGQTEPYGGYPLDLFPVDYESNVW